jgi:hypothetical protein
MAIVRTTDGRYLRVDFDGDVRGRKPRPFGKSRFTDRPLEPAMGRRVTHRSETGWRR